MQYEESLLLPVFLRHYTQYLPKRSIFIIDHGSQTNLIPEGFNRIFVPRERPFSERSRMLLIRSIASGLLEYFDSGIVADCDELIDLGGIREPGYGVPLATYVAGFDVYWENGPEGRRLFGLLNPNECKPLIFNRVPSWGLGFHGSEYPPDVLTIPLAHTRYLYREQSSRRLNDRIAVHQSMQGDERLQGVASHWREGDAELKTFYQIVDQRTQSGTKIHEFAPINPRGLFREVSIEPGSKMYVPNGAWNVTDLRFDLSKHFPTLLE